MAIDVNDILKKAKNSPSSRFSTLNGIKIPTINPNEYSAPDYKDKLADLRDKALGVQLGFEKLDIVLERLHKQWEDETDPLKKELLMIQYDLEVECYGFREESAEKCIQELQKRKEELERSL